MALAGQLSALLLAPPGPPGWAEAAAARGTGLLVRGRQAQLMLDPQEIDWIEAEDYYARVHAGGKHYLVRESLGALETRLASAGFIRVHRGALVRVAQVRELRQTPGGGSSWRSCAMAPPCRVSRRRREVLATRMRGRGVTPLVRPLTARCTAHRHWPDIRGRRPIPCCPDPPLGRYCGVSRDSGVHET